MRIGGVLLVLLALAVAGVAAWWFVLKEPDRTVGTTVDDGPADPVVPRAPRAVDDGFKEAVRRVLPKEGPWDPTEQFEVPVADLKIVRIHLTPTVDRERGPGSALLEAWLKIPEVYVRWVGKDTRESFVKAILRFPPDSYMPESGPMGTPLQGTFGFLDEAGFEGRLDPPVIRIGPKRDGPGG